MTPSHRPHGVRPLLPSASLALLALLAALPTPAAAQASAPAGAGRLPVQGAWRIAQARSEPMLDQRLARLDFNADGRLTGHTSCNPLQGTWRLDGDRLTLGPVTTGRAACRPLLLEQEDRVLTALEAAATARVRDDGLLELRDADGRGVLRATRLPAAP